MAEAARVLRVDPATVYRAIKKNAFPAVRLCMRYVVPAKAVEVLADETAESGEVGDVARMVAERRAVREVERPSRGGAGW
ncbi:helix-turn-helix domain-containing protein [Actinosynnema pretiosum]|uniref:helix-turn-helix domain-containing protein n=1 Tax=Actinosynnema pretiosum TaxID=42197 RepID=UPI001E4D619F|nr:helix-turn-helix domain-containing protein [Actinosynnema pretiosum]